MVEMRIAYKSLVENPEESGHLEILSSDGDDILKDLLEKFCFEDVDLIRVAQSHTLADWLLCIR
jgi:hypothetical protein